jgi:adenylosuccinate synthase
MPCRVVIGLQWGDEGKGKIIDVLAAEADVVLRWQGGGNAGHTIWIDGQKHVLHHLPSGVLRPGVRCLMGAGMVIDPKGLVQEIAAITAAGFDLTGRLFLSERLHLVLPHHRRWDELRDERAGRIGTTKRGIGPAYADKAARIGVRAGRWRDRDVFVQRLRANVEEKNRILQALYGEPPLDPAAVVEEYLGYGRALLPYLADTEALLRQALDAGQRVLAEGAQGIMLDLDHGTYPYVTSSSTGPGGLAALGGVAPREIGPVVGVAKAYVTRVGVGPFPTELPASEGDALREAGGEFGATTGRPRRCGWFDAVAARYAAALAGVDGLAVTKLDVLSGQRRVRVCVGYRLDGQRLPAFPSDAGVLERVQPEYVECEGWQGDLRAARQEADLPTACRAYLDTLERAVGVPIQQISVGPDRAQTLARGGGARRDPALGR